MSKTKPDASSKPPHSKDGRLQLCYRCGKYCRRTLNICPTCYPAIKRKANP